MKYKYTGPTSGINLENKKEIILQNGEIYNLPEESKVVKRLVAKGYLVKITVENKGIEKKEAKNVV